VKAQLLPYRLIGDTRCLLEILDARAVATMERHHWPTLAGQKRAGSVSALRLLAETKPTRPRWTFEAVDEGAIGQTGWQRSTRGGEKSIPIASPACWRIERECNRTPRLWLPQPRRHRPKARRLSATDQRRGRLRQGQKAKR